LRRTETRYTEFDIEPLVEEVSPLFATENGVNNWIVLEQDMPFWKTQLDLQVADGANFRERM